MGDDNRAVRIEASDGTYRFTIDLPSVDFFDWSKASITMRLWKIQSDLQLIIVMLQMV